MYEYCTCTVQGTEAAAAGKTDADELNELFTNKKKKKVKAAAEEPVIATGPSLNEAARAPVDAIGDKTVERDYNYEDVRAHAVCAVTPKLDVVSTELVCVEVR